MVKNMLKRLAENSQTAIDDGTYDVKKSIKNSDQNFLQTIGTNLKPILITEIKFSSPSLGQIRPPADPALIAKQMVAGGAKALSVLTQPYLFNGSPEIFIRVRKAVDVPLLMKDIVIDYVQIDAAKKIGADFILIIQSLHEKGFIKNIQEFIEYGHKKKLKILLEVHTKKEFKHALDTDADLIGINNRNLDTLEIDLNITKKILEGHKKSRPILSESGIKTQKDILFLKKCGVDAFLIGSSIMKSKNIEEKIRKLVNTF